MKQLIVQDKDRIHIDCFAPKELEKKFFGVETSGGGRGFVTRAEFGRGPYRVATCASLTVGNGFWVPSETYELTEFLKELIETEGFMVFVFDDFLELAKWLTEVDKV